MPIDRFESHGDALSSPARLAFAIAPSDSAELAILPKAIVAGSAGTVALRAVDSAADVTLTVQAGQMIPLRVRFVRSTGTTATGLVALA